MSRVFRLALRGALGDFCLLMKSTGRIRVMASRAELVEKYAADMKEHFGVDADADLLEKVVAGLGPSVYDADAELVSASDESEMERVKDNFLVGKLGLADSPDLMAAITSVTDRYGSGNRTKYRAVVYYMLTKHFGKESVYG